MKIDLEPIHKEMRLGLTPEEYIERYPCPCGGREEQRVFLYDMPIVLCFDCVENGCDIDGGICTPQSGVVRMWKDRDRETYPEKHERD